MAEAGTDRILKAHVCEQAGRYEDMITEMKELVQASSQTEPLTVVERNMLSIAYKSVFGSKRASWKVLKSKLEQEQSEKLKHCCNAMKSQVEKELNELCGEILGLLNSKLIPCPENDEAKIFFLKMKGDYYRYMVEICDESQTEARDELTQKSEDAYKKAIEVAKEKLETTNPIRLGLALNYSVFLNEIKKDERAACLVAKTSFDDAILVLDSISNDETYKDTTLILQLLRDYCYSGRMWWSPELNDDNDDDNKGTGQNI